MTLEIVSSEKTAECDCCGDAWEESFFCSECEDRHVEPVLVPDPLWDLQPMGDDMTFEDRPVYKSVCLNCCGGH